MTAKVRPLPEDLQKTACTELNEIPERIPEDIKALRTWIEQQPHLNARTDDQFLLGFLRGCKFRLEKAKSKIDKYYTLKTKYPEFFTIRTMDESRVVDIIKSGTLICLPTPLNENGPRLTLARIGMWPIEKYTYDEVMGVLHAVNEILIREDDHLIVNGRVDIIDTTKFSSAHVVRVTPTYIKKALTFLYEAMPSRHKCSYFIHTSSGLDRFVNFVKSFLSEKQKQRVCIYGSNLDEFYKHIPQKYLPKEYGGENSSIQEIIEASLEKFYEYRQFFLEDVKYGTDETLRQEKTIDYDNIFGIDGTFRKLNVD